ncbi:hypothetical protein BDV19DRAFT_356111 [Aspergillus venezuelensis]
MGLWVIFGLLIWLVLSGRRLLSALGRLLLGLGHLAVDAGEVNVAVWCHGGAVVGLGLVVRFGVCVGTGASAGSHVLGVVVVEQGHHACGGLSINVLRESEAILEAMSASWTSSRLSFSAVGAAVARRAMCNATARDSFIVMVMGCCT